MEIENSPLYDVWQKRHQPFEKEFWGNCLNTFAEEAKQIVYAHHMGIEYVDGPRGEWPCYNAKGMNILDIGGGPCSMLLKTLNRGACMTVIDPCRFPHWVISRYSLADIDFRMMAAESCDPSFGGYDEVWIYNTLQHVIDPQLVIQTAFKFMAMKPLGVIRIFEWIDVPTSEGHPHKLTTDNLTDWLGDFGKIDNVNCNGAVGKAFYGVFKRPN
jgi:2-polyprenyl-3-methyl-5-hydroxy-6-metoxy-1,4-benzoquinol methylase